MRLLSLLMTCFQSSADPLGAQSLSSDQQSLLNKHICSSSSPPACRGQCTGRNIPSTRRTWQPGKHIQSCIIYSRIGEQSRDSRAKAAAALAQQDKAQERADSYLLLLHCLTLGTAQPFWEKQLHIPDCHCIGSGAWEINTMRRFSQAMN